MHIVITDLHSASNRGDAAILGGVLCILRQAFPAARFTVLTEYPDSVPILLGIPAKKQRYVPFRPSGYRTQALLLYSLFAAYLTRFQLNLPSAREIWRHFGFDELAGADLVVSTGGSHINDFYSPGCVGRLIGFYFAKLLGKPVVLLCQSLGPFETSLLRSVAKYVLNRVDLIATRDAKTLTLLEELRVSRPKIAFTADAAFALPRSIKHDHFPRAESAPSFPASCLRISISVRYWSHYKSSQGHLRYVEILAALADWLVQSKKAAVTFVSTCTGFAGYHKDDRVTAFQIVERMKARSSSNPVVLCNEYTPAQLSALYGEMDLHIGTRMHSNILSLLAGTPIVALEYEFKTAELMAQMALSEFVISVDALSLDSLIEKVELALARRTELRKTIPELVANLRNRALSSAELIKSVVSSRISSSEPGEVCGIGNQSLESLSSPVLASAHHLPHE